MNLTLYSHLKPAFSLSDMFAIWAVMFLTGIFLFVGGPFLLLSGKVGVESSGLSVSSCCGLSSVVMKFYNKKMSTTFNTICIISLIKIKQYICERHLRFRYDFLCSDCIVICCLTLEGLGVFFVIELDFLLYLSYKSLSQ